MRAACSHASAYRNNPKMCLLEMGSLQAAVEALIALHDYKMGDQNIRVSFSKSSL